MSLMTPPRDTATPKRQSALLSLALSLLVVLLSSCATTRYVDEGQYLLRQVRIEIDSTARDTPLPSDLMSYVGQKPNRKLFGLFDWTLGLYSLSKRESNSWLNRKLRQWGSAPVIYSPDEAEHSVSNLTSAVYNQGYLRATTTLRLDTLSSKKLRTTYHIRLGERFAVSRHREFIRDSLIQRLLHPEDARAELRRYPNERYRSLIDSGVPLSPELLQDERRRITMILRNRGQWHIHEEQIRFEVDTLTGARDAWVHTHIDAEARTHRIGRVTLSEERRELQAPFGAGDTRGSGSARGAGEGKPEKPRIRESVLASRLHISSGDRYDQEATRRSYSALSDLSAIRSVGIRYQIDSLAPEPTLDVAVEVTPEQRMEVAADLIATHSGGNLGVNSSLSWLHNNLFGGSEQFRILARVGYEELSGLSRNHASYGGELSMRIPRLSLPFSPISKQRLLRGQTQLSLSYDFLTRPEFQRNLFASSLSYAWSRIDRPAWSYTVRPLEVDYMHFSNIDESFLAQIPIYTRQLSYRDLFVVGTSLRMEYHSSKDYRHILSPYRHVLRLYLQSAGNVLRLVSPLLGAERDEFGSYAVMRTNYAQFVRAELDYSGQYRLGGKNALAYRAGLSLVYPYGNSRILPIDLRYFSGGSSSVRGWGVRELGVGSLPREQAQTIMHQVGDLKLDLGVELRLRFSRSWEWAGFVDAGNIWTLRRYDYQPQGDFRFNRFFREIALSTGMGLRWDFDYFIVRLDAGLKLYDPQAPEGKRWTAFGRSSLRDLTALHIALGYPF